MQLAPSRSAHAERPANRNHGVRALRRAQVQKNKQKTIKTHCQTNIACVCVPLCPKQRALSSNAPHKAFRANSPMAQRVVCDAAQGCLSSRRPQPICTKQKPIKTETARATGPSFCAEAQRAHKQKAPQCAPCTRTNQRTTTHTQRTVSAAGVCSVARVERRVALVGRRCKGSPATHRRTAHTLAAGEGVNVFTLRPHPRCIACKKAELLARRARAHTSRSLCRVGAPKLLFGLF